MLAVELGAREMSEKAGLRIEWELLPSLIK